jgi:hypothetical protein
MYHILQIYIHAMFFLGNYYTIMIIFHLYKLPFTICLSNIKFAAQLVFLIYTRWHFLPSPLTLAQRCIMLGGSIEIYIYIYTFPPQKTHSLLSICKVSNMFRHIFTVFRPSDIGTQA